MRKPCVCVVLCLTGLPLHGAWAASGAEYPNKPIRILTSGAGGASDIPARIISQGISAALHQPVIVENRANQLAIDTVSQSAPDGYSVLLFGSSVWLLPLMQKVAWEPIKSFAPLTLAVSSPNILVVYPGLPIKSVKDLIAVAKARPGELNYGTGTIGSPTHLAAELFKYMAGVNLVRVTYKGGAPTVSALIAGEIQVSFATATSVAPHLNSGKLRALAVTSAQPSTLVPGLPTIAAAGVPNYESVGAYGMWLPARTPEPIVRLLNQHIVNTLNSAEAKEKLISVGVESVASTPAELTAFMKSDIDRIGKVIKAAGMRAD